MSLPFFIRWKGDSGIKSIPTKSIKVGAIPVIEMILQCNSITPRMLVNKAPNAMFNGNKNPVTPRMFGVAISPK